MMSSVDGLSRSAGSADVVDAECRAAAVDLALREVALLDDGEFEKWLTIWEPDGIYWVPLGDPDENPELSLSIIYDNSQGGREQRVRRALHESAWAVAPRAETIRLLTNLRVTGETPSTVAGRPATVELRGNLALATYRNGRHTTRFAKVVYSVAARGTEVSLLMKKVILIDRSGVFENLVPIL